MKKDISWSDYFADARRFADLVNVHGCGGEQLVSPQDVLMENPHLSLRLWMNQRWRDVTKFRDEVRRVIFNANVAVVGFENQETIDYSYPLRDKFKNAPAFLLRGMHRLCRYQSCACLCNPAGGYIRWEIELPLIQVCCSQAAEVGVISHLIYLWRV